MKFLFTAPRFHTNQAPIVKGLIEKGHIVRYFVAFCGATEEHTFCNPTVMKMSHYMKQKVDAYRKHNKESDVESYIGSQFVPDMKWLEQEFLRYEPDVVICRENTRLTLCVHSLCKKYNIPCIMYDQQPYYNLPSVRIVSGEVNPVQRASFQKRLVNKIKRLIDEDMRLIDRLLKSVGYPMVRMTPVLASKYVADLLDAPACKNTYFIPFVGEASEYAMSRGYMQGGKLQILCVGKYREYKNLPLFVEAISLLPQKNTVSVTVLGQVSTFDEQEYFNNLQRQIEQLGLGSVITLKKNVPYNQMEEVYLQHDVLVLPTKREWASVSVIEAMAHGLAVISTDCNGTATYIHPPICGYIFESGNAKDLAKKIGWLLQENNIEKYGKAAYENIKNRYSFENYYSVLMNMLINEFDFSREELNIFGDTEEN